MKNADGTLTHAGRTKAMFRIAERITVGVDAAVIASDTPAEVRNNPSVQIAHLGAKCRGG